MGFGVPISLTVVDIFQPISTRSRWGTWMHNAHGCISGLILHGAFQTKFLGILYHKLSTFILGGPLGVLSVIFKYLEY